MQSAPLSTDRELKRLDTMSKNQLDAIPSAKIDQKTNYQNKGIRHQNKEKAAQQKPTNQTGPISTQTPATIQASINIRCRLILIIVSFVLVLACSMTVLILNVIEQKDGFLSTINGIVFSSGPLYLTVKYSQNYYALNLKVTSLALATSILLSLTGILLLIFKRVCKAFTSKKQNQQSELANPALQTISTKQPLLDKTQQPQINDAIDNKKTDTQDNKEIQGTSLEQAGLTVGLSKLLIVLYTLILWCLIVALGHHLTFYLDWKSSNTFDINELKIFVFIGLQALSLLYTSFAYVLTIHYFRQIQSSQLLCNHQEQAVKKQDVQIRKENPEKLQKAQPIIKINDSLLTLNNQNIKTQKIQSITKPEVKDIKQTQKSQVKPKLQNNELATVEETPITQNKAPPKIPITQNKVPQNIQNKTVTKGQNKEVPIAYNKVVSNTENKANTIQQIRQFSKPENKMVVKNQASKNQPNRQIVAPNDNPKQQQAPKKQSNEVLEKNKEQNPVIKEPMIKINSPKLNQSPTVTNLNPIIDKSQPKPSQQSNPALLPTSIKITDFNTQHQPVVKPINEAKKMQKNQGVDAEMHQNKAEKKARAQIKSEQPLERQAPQISEQSNDKKESVAQPIIESSPFVLQPLTGSYPHKQEAKSNSLNHHRLQQPQVPQLSKQKIFRQPKLIEGPHLSHIALNQGPVTIMSPTNNLSRPNLTERVTTNTGDTQVRPIPSKGIKARMSEQIVANNQTPHEANKIIHLELADLSPHINQPSKSLNSFSQPHNHSPSSFTNSTPNLIQNHQQYVDLKPQVIHHSPLPIEQPQKKKLSFCSGIYSIQQSSPFSTMASNVFKSKSQHKDPVIYQATSYTPVINKKYPQQEGCQQEESALEEKFETNKFRKPNTSNQDDNSPIKLRFSPTNKKAPMPQQHISSRKFFKSPLVKPPKNTQIHKNQHPQQPKRIVPLKEEVYDIYGYESVEKNTNSELSSYQSGAQFYHNSIKKQIDKSNNRIWNHSTAYSTDNELVKRRNAKFQEKSPSSGTEASYYDERTFKKSIKKIEEKKPEQIKKKTPQSIKIFNGQAMSIKEEQLNKIKSQEAKIQQIYLDSQRRIQQKINLLNAQIQQKELDNRLIQESVKFMNQTNFNSVLHPVIQSNKKLRQIQQKQRVEDEKRKQEEHEMKIKIKEEKLERLRSELLIKERYRLAQEAKLKKQPRLGRKREGSREELRMQKEKSVRKRSREVSRQTFSNGQPSIIINKDPNTSRDQSSDDQYSIKQELYEQSFQRLQELSDIQNPSLKAYMERVMYKRRNSEKNFNKNGHEPVWVQKVESPSRPQMKNMYTALEKEGLNHQYRKLDFVLLTPESISNKKSIANK